MGILYLLVLFHIAEEAGSYIQGLFALYTYMKRRLLRSHQESTVTGTLLVDSARIQLLSFLYKILHIPYPCNLFSLFHFTSSARALGIRLFCLIVRLL
jgi:hypothetical protein